MQEVELYAEVHRDVAASNYTPIAREACSSEEHVSCACSPATCITVTWPRTS